MRTLQARNPRLVRLGQLSRRRRARDEAGQFVVDGPKLLAEALDAALPCREVFVDPARIDPDLAALVARAEAAGAEIFGVDATVLRRVTDPVTPQAVAAVVERPRPAPDLLARATAALVLAEVTDPGNAGTLVRAAVASGVDVVVTTVGTVDLFAPKTVRASAGAVLRVPIHAGDAVAATLGDVTGAGLRTTVAVLDDARPYDAIDLTVPTAIVVGNEAHGLAPEVIAGADLAVRIPMVGPVESLNVAMAGTVLCFEMLRQRRTRDADLAGLAADPDGRV